MTDIHETNRSLLAPLRSAMYHWDAATIRDTLETLFVDDAIVHLAFPFEDLDGARGWWGDALTPLETALPDLERRDWIVMAGEDARGNAWVGCGGHYTGTWMAPFLDIPPTGQQAAMRFHEFFRIVDGRVVEVQALWDIPELMIQAGVWPMGPSLGHEWRIPGPATQDGILNGPRDTGRSAASTTHIVEMLADMGRHPTEPEEAMRLEHWWHPHFSWYGPAGIGTARGIAGFRHWHQIPFLKAMPDRGGEGYEGGSHFFGDGDYVGVTAWPGMAMTITGDGWLGIVPTGRAITMRSLDFWRVEHNTGRSGQTTPKIRENWVLVDLLHVWDQLGVSVFDRMRELAEPQRQVLRYRKD